MTLDNPFWQFSMEFYALEGVAPTCLALQDDCGVDVNVLLFLRFLARANRCLEQGALLELIDLTRAWRERVVQPIREVRREVRELDGDLYEQLKTLELLTEQHQQAVMWQWYLKRERELAENSGRDWFEPYLRVLDAAVVPRAEELLRQLVAL